MGQMQGAFGRSWMRQPMQGMQQQPQSQQSNPFASMFSQYMQRPMFQAAMQRPAQNFMNYLPLLLSRGMFNAPQQGATAATAATPATATAPAVPALPAVPPIQNVPSIASQAPPPTYQATPAINPAAAPAPAPAAAGGPTWDGSKWVWPQGATSFDLSKAVIPERSYTADQYGAALRAGNVQSGWQVLPNPTLPWETERAGGGMVGSFLGG